MSKESIETKSPFLSVDFWFKIVGAAILLALSIWGILDFDGIGKVLVVFVCAFFIILFELIQVFPAFKVVKNGKARAFIILEILIDLVIGVFVFYCGVVFAKFNNNNPDGWNKVVVDLLDNNQIHIILTGIVLYIRGINYFIASVLFNEPTKAKIFWTQVLFMTFGVICIASATKLNVIFTWLIIILALISGAYIGGSGGVSFYRYKKFVNDHKNTEEEVNDEISKDAPARNEEIYEDEEESEEIYIDPDDSEIKEDKSNSKADKKRKKNKNKRKRDTPAPEVIIPDDDENHPYAS